MSKPATVHFDLEIDLQKLYGTDYDSFDEIIIFAIQEEIKNQIKLSTKNIRAKVKAAIAKEEAKIAKKMTLDIMKGIDKDLAEKLG